MLSFVVQNFYTNNNVTRTKKYNNMVLLTSSRLFFLFLKNNIHILFYKQSPFKVATSLLRIYDRNFIKPAWSTYTALSDFRYGLYTNNLSKSLTFHSIDSLTTFSKKNNNTIVNSIGPNSRWLSHYVLHIPTASFPIWKDLYNTVIMYYLNFLVQDYTPTRNYFKLVHNFIILPRAFTLYFFWNSFYFRIWNY